VTVATSKVPTTAIEQIRKAIQDAPECLAKEVPKVQAIRALIPDIRQMKAKGYDWKAIASLLSEHGVPVTAVTLKSYLQQAKAGRGKKARRKGDAADGVPRSASGAIRSPAGRGPAGTPRGANSRTGKASPGAPPAVIAKQPSAETVKTSRPPAQDADARRSAFVPEEDTDDI
jgi:hypothetical protein